MLDLNSVYFGDCLEVMKSIDNNSIDFILADLPYGTTKCKWDTVIPFDSLWLEYKRILKPGGTVALFGTEPFSSFLRISNISWYRYDWVWNKVTARGHLVAKKRPMQQTECISIFYTRNNIYNPQMIDRPIDKIKVRKKTEYKRTDIMGGTNNAPKNIVYDKWYPKTLLTYSNAASSVKSIHPTQKPVDLLSYLIKTYTNIGDLVLDNVAGSGSTGVACKQTNRNFILIEKDEYYFNVCKNRIDE